MAFQPLPEVEDVDTSLSPIKIQSAVSYLQVKSAYPNYEELFMKGETLPSPFLS